SRYCLLSLPVTGIVWYPYRMTKNMRPMFASAAALSVLVLAACGGDGAHTPVDPTPPPAVSVAGVESAPEEEVEEVEGAPGEEVGEVGAGRALGEVSGGDGVATGMDPGEAVSLDGAGVVGARDGSCIEYPDGLRIDCAGATPGSAPGSEEQGDLDPDRALVRLTVTVTNAGPDAL